MWAVRLHNRPRVEQVDEPGPSTETPPAAQEAMDDLEHGRGIVVFLT